MSENRPSASSPSSSHRRTSLVAVAIVAALVVPALLSACGGGEEPPAALSAEALTGWQVARDAGCVSCHGDRGEGSVGPAWIGLAGSTVILEDGRRVVADGDYLRRAIVDPGAEVVDGYAIAMPKAVLDDAQVDALIAYIEALR